MADEHIQTEQELRIERRRIAAEKRRAVAAKKVRALEMRGEGSTYRAIAAELDCSVSVAFEYVDSELRKLPREAAERVRELELGRLDTMLNAIWKKVTNGNIRAIETALRIMARRAALLGLDKPVTVNVQNIVADVAAELNLTPEESTDLASQVEHFLAISDGRA